MSLEVRLLGSVEALVDGQTLSLGGSKQRSVVAMLALHANSTLSGDELIDGLWGEDPPPSAAKNLQHYVSRLRKTLADGKAEAEIITRGRGYELRLPNESVDALRFEDLVREASREPASAAGANGAAGAALELWRGAPLADVASEPFAAPEIGRLEELRLRAIELAIDAELAAGHHDEVVAQLEELIAQEPLRERLHAQRMLALYRAGRQAEALEAYREARGTLIEQIGVEPGPELQRLQAAVLAQDPSLDAPPAIMELPVQLEGGSPLLAGRERELRWLRQRWHEAGEGRVLCALVWGPAGIGKTRLVAELAHELQREGAAVLYAGGGQVAEVALTTVAEAGKGQRPTLLVVDSADDAPPAVLEAAAKLARDPEGRPLLICVLHHDEQGPPAFASLLDSGAAQRLRLDPLGEAATAEIAALYVPAEDVAMPLSTLVVDSEGVPLRIHRAAGEWARAEAAERLAATTDRAAGDRTGLRATQAAVAGGVVDLQTASERARLYAVAEPPDPSELAICPFRGLAPFDAAHAEYFFGRERLTAELVARLVGSTLLAVIGPSGSGKSSAVRAGLLPALADGVVPGSERWLQAVMRPGEHPLAELSRTLGRAVPEMGAEDPAPWIADALEHLPVGERLVLAVDQFEEAFVACRDEAERVAFLDALVEGAADPDERLVIVLAIRADFYGRCAEHAELSTIVSANQVLVGPMRRDELRRAIELPARRAGLRVEPRLVAALVGDVAGEPGGLPLLSAALLELWQRREGRTLRHSAYERIGGVEGAVARLAEDAYERLSPDERRRARPMLLRLAGEAEDATALVRRRVPIDELELDRDKDAARALAVFTESRLLTVDDDTVEVAHEALLREWPRLRSWLEEDAEGRRLHLHLIGAAREWRDSGRDPAELYRGARLAAALDWAAEHDPELNELEREFLGESQTASEREAERQRRANQRLRALLVGVGILLAAAVVAGVIAISERQSAQDAARIEAAQRLGAQALNEDPIDRGLQLAGAGGALDDSVATRGNLLAALLRNPPAELGRLLGTPDNTPIYAVAASPDGGLLAVGDAAGTVTILDASSRRPLGKYQLGDAPGGGLVQTLTFSPDGKTLAVTGHEPPDEPPGALVDLIDPRTQERRVRTVLPPPHGSVFTFANVAFVPDGRDFVVIQDPSEPPSVLRRVDGRTGEIEGSPVQVGRSGAFGLFPASDRQSVFVTSAQDDVTREIDVRTLRVVRRYSVGGTVGALSPDGTTFALGSEAGTVRTLDPVSGRVRRFTSRNEAGVRRLAFTPDGRKLVSSHSNGGVMVWDVATGGISEELSAHRDEVHGLAVSPDGRTLYSSANDAQAILWDLGGDRRLIRPFPVEPPFALRDTPRGIAVSPDGRTLALTNSDGSVDLTDTDTLRRQGSLRALHGFAAAVGYSPDGRLLAVAGERGRVTLWHARTLAPAGELRGLPADSQALAFSPDGKLLAAAVNTGAPLLRVWNVPRRAPTALSKTLAASLAFSPDGELFAAAALDRGTEIRDAQTARLVERIPTEGLSRSVTFSPDGSLLAVGQYDGVGRLYSTDGWEPLGGPLEGHTQRITYVAFSPDGRTLATASADGTVRLWDVGTQQPIGPPLTVEPNTFASAAFSPNSAHLFAVSTRGPGFRFDTDPRAWSSHACTVAGGGLTPEQWEEIVPEQDFVSVCPPG
jgi:WD40 repeat protein/DNA-binding SARP family transcriptional activator